MNKTLPFLFLFVSFVSQLSAQGFKGYVYDENNKPLPFASIYVQEIGTGTSSNADGYFELQLAAGIYKVTFQYIGFGPQTKTLKVTDGFTRVDVNLQPESVTLNTVTITEDAENPAYTIMRKAISKAKFHLLQTDSYSAEVYTKGTGQIKKVPWAIRKMAETADEPIDTSQVFTSESVSEYSFERPNTYKEKVISIRASGENDNSVSPNSYFNTSFYLPEVVGAISPLSPKAFSYYRFTFLGSFNERGYEINKIQVTPRSKGDAVYEGIIYIRENFWNIHSLYLNTKQQGFDIRIEQILGPVLEEIWMPVTNKLKVSGSIMGVELEYNYLASISNYQIVPNKDFNPNITILDEKIDPIPEEIKAKEKKADEKDAKEQIAADKKMTRKRMAELVEAYEEQQIAEETPEEKNVVSNEWYEIDTAATKKDSAYWASRRPVPLTEKEKVGYKVKDSVYVVEEQDSTAKVDGRPFRVGDIFFGGKYALGENMRFRFQGFLPQFRFNTVEGFNLDMAGTFTWKNDTAHQFYVSPAVRYGFSGTRLYGKIDAGFYVGKRPHKKHWNFSGGKYIYQFNDASINPLINSLYSLFLARNYMKLYEKTFAKFNYTHPLSYKYRFSVGAEYAVRNQLYNRTDFSFFKPNDREYLPNAPMNLETIVGPFDQNKAFLTTAKFEAEPWLKYRRYNGKLIPIQGSSPVLSLTYNAGWDGVFESSTDFQQLELGVHTEFDLGVRASLEFDIQAGTF